LHEFDVELHRLREELKDVPRDHAVRLAEDYVRAKARDVLLRIPPPRVAPPPPAIVPEQVPVRVRVEEVRRPEMVERTCVDCEREFMVDRDLEKRLTDFSTEIRGRGRVVYNGPVLTFPRAFYYLCSECKKRRFGYSSVEDAVAFQLLEGEITGKLRLTVEDLRELGLTDEDIMRIMSESLKYRPKEGR